MPLDMMREAVKRRNAVAPGIQLEASGGVICTRYAASRRLASIVSAFGALTHSAPALDIALDYES